MCLQQHQSHLCASPQALHCHHDDGGCIHTRWSVAEGVTIKQLLTWSRAYLSVKDDGVPVQHIIRPEEQPEVLERLRNPEGLHAVCEAGVDLPHILYTQLV